MCSRYSLTSPSEAVRAYFSLERIEDFPPRYNIAPTQPVGIVRTGHAGAREFALVRWGLIPSWVKDVKAFSTLINARSESAADKPSFRAAFRHRRCLVPASGFYEWTGAAGAKQPHLVRRRDGGPMAFAGLWEHWQDAGGSELETMTILTVAANKGLAWLHDRMPVILAPDAFDMWLDCKSVKADMAAVLLQPAPEGILETVAVSRTLNNPRNEGPAVQEPATR